MTRELVRLLQEHTGDGYVFRTDLRLRPDPGATQVALSTDAGLSYYESLGQNWERAAWIKARAIAGDVEAGEEFLRQLAPFVWRKYLDFASIADIHAMSARRSSARSKADCRDCSVWVTRPMAASEAKRATSTGTARRSSSVLGRCPLTLPRSPCQIGAAIANSGCCAELIRDIRSPLVGGSPARAGELPHLRIALYLRDRSFSLSKEKLWKIG